MALLSNLVTSGQLLNAVFAPIIWAGSLRLAKRDLRLQSSGD